DADRSGPVDTGDRPPTAGAPYRSWRSGRQPDLHLGLVRRRAAEDDDRDTPMGLPRRHPPLDLSDAGQAPRRSLGPIHHLVVARWHGDVRRRSGVGPVALLATPALPNETGAVSFAVRGVDVVAPLRGPDLR